MSQKRVHSFCRVNLENRNVSQLEAAMKAVILNKDLCVIQPWQGLLIQPLKTVQGNLTHDMNAA